MQTILKHLREILPKNSGRDASGQVSIRHQGGRHKRYWRRIDWKRNKDGIAARVIGIEYDPNRSSDLALLQYADGEKRYILSPEGLGVGSEIISGIAVEAKVGNAMTLGAMPVGTVIHAVELKPGTGAQMMRSAGTSGAVLSKDENLVQVKLPSGEIRAFPSSARATVGSVGNLEWKNRILGSAGRARHMGRRPTVRGVAQNPRSHPHGGGEGRSGIGMPSPKSPWGKGTLGNKTRKKRKYSDRFIVQRRP